MRDFQFYLISCRLFTIASSLSNLDELLHQGGWLGACGCTTDSNYAVKVGHYCECEELVNFNVGGNDTISPLCLSDGFERTLANACIHSCEDKNCLGLIKSAVICWGPPYQKWGKGTLHPAFEKCLLAADRLFRFGGVSTDFSKTRYPLLPWTVGNGLRGDPGMGRCRGKPRTIHQITWADSPHRAVQHGRRTAEKCGWLHHYVHIVRGDPTKKAPAYWFTAIMNQTEEVVNSFDSQCDLVYLHDAHDVLTMPNCDLLYEKFETFDTDMVFSAELSSWPEKDVWTKLRSANKQTQTHIVN